MKTHGVFFVPTPSVITSRWTGVADPVGSELKADGRPPGQLGRYPTLDEMAKRLRTFEQLMVTAARWFAEEDELLASSHFSAGDSDYLFCRNLEDLIWFAKNSGSEFRRQICLYRGKSLPLRGVVNEEFIQKVLAMVPDNTECKVLRLKPFKQRLLSGNFCDDHRELIEELNDEFGEPVAIGLLPDTGFMMEYPEPDIRGWDHCVVASGMGLDDVYVP